VLSVLTRIYGLQVLDRQIVAELLEPIGREFALTDAQLGLLGSLGLAVASAVTCVPLGMLADRTARKQLLGVVCVSGAASLH